MSFDKLAMKRSNNGRWENVFRQPRTMNNGRLLGTALSLTLGLVLCYSSIFYVPAFVDINKAIGISNSARLSDSNALDPYINFIKPNRTYLKQGQGVEAIYAKPKGMNGELVFYRCEAPVILEVFQCDRSIIKRVRLGRGSTGKRALQVKQSGFFGFDIVLSDPKVDYNVAWIRRY